jgi:hypothetical protein
LRVWRLLTLLGALFSFTHLGWADLLGTSVSGTLSFPQDPTNWFDPANPFVPTGFLNVTGTTVVISNPDLEFGFDDGLSAISVDFTGSKLLLKDDVAPFDGAPWIMTFSDSSFSGLVLTTVSDRFGLRVAKLEGHQITLDWEGTSVAGTYTAEFDIATPAAVPEPSFMWLTLAVCAVVLVMIRYRSGVLPGKR